MPYWTIIPALHYYCRTVGWVDAVREKVNSFFYEQNNIKNYLSDVSDARLPSLIPSVRVNPQMSRWVWSSTTRTFPKSTEICCSHKITNDCECNFLQAGGLCFPPGSFSTNVNPSVSYAQLVSHSVILFLENNTCMFFLLVIFFHFLHRRLASSLPGLWKTSILLQQLAL